jgi:putative tricarboxylic transport membrane protein
MSRRDEWLGAAAWAALGTAIVTGSWRMDRLGHQGINPWSAPGLTPGVVGALMILFACALALQARSRSVPEDEPVSPPAAGTLWRTVLATVLCLTFAGVALGHGWPFPVEAAAFIFAFTSVFRWDEWRRAGRQGRGLLQTLLIAVVAAGLISWLFESVFLVRLP